MWAICSLLLAPADQAIAGGLIAPEISRLLVLLEVDDASRSYAIAELRLLGERARPGLEIVAESGAAEERAVARELLGRPPAAGVEPRSASPASSAASASPAASATPAPTPPAQETKDAKATPEQIAAWIVDLRHADPHTRWGAVSALGSEEATQAIPELVAGIVRCRDDSGDWHVYWRSLWALNTMPDPKAAVPFMRDQLHKAETWRDSWNAAVGLCYLRVSDPEALAFLRKTLAEDHPENLKAFSILSFSYAGSDELFAIVDRFIAGPTPNLHSAALDALRNWPADDPRRWSAIVRLLDDASDQVRWRAAMHLGQYRTEEVVRALHARLAVETDDNVRKHILKSLAKLGEDVQVPND